MVMSEFPKEQQRFLPRLLHSRGHFPAPCSTFQVHRRVRSHPRDHDSRNKELCTHYTWNSRHIYRWGLLDIQCYTLIPPVPRLDLGVPWHSDRGYPLRPLRLCLAVPLRPHRTGSFPKNSDTSTWFNDKFRPLYPSVEHEWLTFSGNYLISTWVRPKVV